MAPTIFLKQKCNPDQVLEFSTGSTGREVHRAALIAGWGEGIIAGPDGIVGSESVESVPDGDYVFQPTAEQPAGSTNLVATVRDTVKEVLRDEEFVATIAAAFRRASPLEFSASSVNSADLATALSRLRFTIQRRQTLPCCLSGYPSAQLTIAEYRWEQGEASKAEAKKAKAWLEQHVCPPGVVAVPVTSVGWMQADWPADGVRIKTSKTNFLLVTKNVAAPLLKVLKSSQLSEGLLLEALIGLLAAYEAKTTTEVAESGIHSLWKQTTAELLALNFMLEHDAGVVGRRVPVFGGDFNLHIITHHNPDDRTEIHCAGMTDTSMPSKKLAVGIMRGLLGQLAASAGANQGGGSEGPADAAGLGEHQQQQQQPPPPPQPRSSDAPSAPASQPRYQLRSGGKRREAAMAVKGEEHERAPVISLEQEEAYHAAMYAFMRQPAVYESFGKSCPPHTVRHNTLAEKLASMRSIL